MDSTWNCILTLIGHSKKITSSDKELTLWGDNETSAISPNGEILATTDRWGSIRVRNLETQEILCAFNCSYHPEKEYSPGDWMHEFLTKMSDFGQSCLLAILSNGKTLVYANAEEIKVWDLEIKELQHTLPGSSSTYVNLKQELITIEQNSDKIDRLLLEVWHLMTGKFLYAIDTGFSQSLDHIDISLDGKLLAVAGTHLLDWGYDNDNNECFKVENSIKVWDLDSKVLLCKLKINIDTRSESESPLIAINPNGRTLITVNDWLSDIPLAEVWDLNTGEKLFTLPEQVDRGVFAISPDGDLIISSTKDCTIKIWDSNSGKVLHTLSGHSDLILSFAISQDSLTFFSSSKDKTIRIWNLQTGELMKTLTSHSCSVKSLFLNLNEKVLVSTDVQGTVKVWKKA